MFLLQGHCDSLEGDKISRLGLDVRIQGATRKLPIMKNHLLTRNINDLIPFKIIFLSIDALVRA